MHSVFFYPVTPEGGP